MKYFLFCLIFSFGVSSAFDSQLLASECDLFQTIEIGDQLQIFFQAARSWFESRNEVCSKSLACCCQNLKDGIRFLPVVEVRQALPDLLSFAASGSYRLDRLDDQDPIGENNNSDFSGTYQILCQLQRSLDQCCAALQEDFQETWTILENISTDFRACCLALESLIATEFNQTWTILNELHQTVTTCCATLEQLIANDFAATWTILKEVTDDQNGTFTVLDTILNSLAPTCSATILLTPTTISSPGTYCLGASISTTDPFAINIVADNIFLDLNGNEVSAQTGILIANSAKNISIVNGTIINSSSAGISVGNSANNILIKNVNITACTPTALLFSTSTTNCSVDNVIINGPMDVGIAAQNATGLLLSNIIIQGSNINNSVYGITITGLNRDIIISNVVIKLLTSQGGAAYGINLTNAVQCLLDNVTVFDIRSISADAYGITSDSSSIILQNSIVDNVLSDTSDSWGVLVNSSQSAVSNIKVRNITGGRVGFGIEYRDSSLCSLTDSLAEIIRGGSGTNIGIFLNTTNDSSIVDCVVRDVPYKGIVVGGPSGNVLKNCQVYSCGLVGIDIGSLALVDSCAAVNCVGTGILDAVGTNTVTNCYAWQNATNYSGISTVYSVGTPVLAGYNLSA